MEEIHLIDINKTKNKLSDRLNKTDSNLDFSYIEKEFTKLITLEEKINKCLTNDTKSKIELGGYLNELKVSYVYKFSGYDTFEAYCLNVIGISKEYVNRLIQIYDFVNRRDVASVDFTLFTISQLQEIITLNDDQLKKISPTMTIKEIRSFKNQQTSTNSSANVSENVLNNTKVETEKYYKPTIKDFNIENTTYSIDFFDNFSRPDLAYIAWQLYAELNRLRKANQTKNPNIIKINKSNSQKKVLNDN